MGFVGDRLGRIAPWIWACTSIAAIAVSAGAQEPPAAAPADAAATAEKAPAKPARPTAKTPKAIFLQVLKEYKRYPKEYFEREGIDPKSIEKVDVALIDQLSPAVLKARYNEHNVAFLKNKALQDKILSIDRALKTKLDQTPLTDFAVRKEVELKYQLYKSRVDQANFNLFMISINANRSLMQALATLTPEAKERAKTEVAAGGPGAGAGGVAGTAKKEDPGPRLPGQFQGTAAARRKIRDSEKDFLTPVDADFYSTQLGKKLESDLGGRVDSWSYDYPSDELYVKVGSEVAKVSVFQGNDGVRFIRTRSGQAFSERRTADERIDMLKAKGRFLTGDKSEETLFGKMPDKRVKTIEEDFGPGHSKGDGHDHSGHDH